MAGLNLKVFILPRVAELFIHKEKQRGCHQAEDNLFVSPYEWLDCLELRAGLKPDWQSQGQTSPVCCLRGIAPRFPGSLVAYIQALLDFVKILRFFPTLPLEEFFQEINQYKE